MLGLGLVSENAVALEIDEEVVPVGFIRRDIEYSEVEHCEESEAFVKLGKRQQDPGRVVEPERKQIEDGGYWSEDDYSD